VQALGGAPEMQLLGDGDEVANTTEFHGAHARRADDVRRRPAVDSFVCAARRIVADARTPLTVRQAERASRLGLIPNATRSPSSWSTERQ
jgi:hypothetical protein